MSLSVLLVQRLSPQVGLDESTAKAAKPGKMAALMEERSGLPPQNERDVLAGRQELFKKSRKTATLLVYPARAAGGSAAANAAEPNELEVLWDFAREVREHARKSPPDADYALYADYVFSPDHWEQGFVHFVICDRKGDWVIVDFQNSHHLVYQGSNRGSSGPFWAASPAIRWSVHSPR